MKTTSFPKYAGTLVALAICSACGGGSAGAPPTAALNDTHYTGKILRVNGTPVTAARLNPMPRYATLVPDRITKSKNYEYISNNYGTYADIFDYPKSDRQVGKIEHVGGQACTNVLYGYGKHIFWIVQAHGRIIEYGVPKKQLKRLADSVGMPSSCAMNTNGDLAVGIFGGSGRGDVVIYKNASGSGTVMTTQLNSEYFDAYDNHGNLFADGWNSSDTFQLVELPSGSSTFEPIAISNTVKFPGSLQWDGSYFTIFDQVTSEFYRYTISGTTATLKGTVQLIGASDCSQTWIVKGFVYCADAGNDGAELFKYPAGGSPIAAFTGNFVLPLGVTAVRK
jgi:hypothetical protein